MRKKHKYNPRKGQALNVRILACPECPRRFTTVKNLNIHLARRHDAPYMIRLPRSLVGTTCAIPRPKRAE